LRAAVVQPHFLYNNPHLISATDGNGNAVDGYTCGV